MTYLTSMPVPLSWQIGVLAFGYFLPFSCAYSTYKYVPIRGLRVVVSYLFIAIGFILNWISIIAMITLAILFILLFIKDANTKEVQN